MNRQEKAAVIDFLKDECAQSKAAFLVGVSGLTVARMQKLRRQLRSEGGKLKVAKPRLMKLALENAQGASMLLPYCKGQIGIVFALQEAPTVAKVLRDFAKENEALKLVVGQLDTMLLERDGIIRIASLPSREVLLSQLCGVLKAPITKLAFVLKQVSERQQSN